MPRHLKSRYWAAARSADEAAARAHGERRRGRRGRPDLSRHATGPDPALIAAMRAKVSTGAAAGPMT